MCEERYLTDYNKQDWWTFLASDQLSVNYQRICPQAISKLTQALRPQEACVKSMGSFQVALLYGLATKEALWQCMDGALSPEWWRPWRAHLESLGVKVVTKAELASFDAPSQTATLADGTRVDADAFVMTLPMEVMHARLQPGGGLESLAVNQPQLTKLAALPAAEVPVGWMSGIQYVLKPEVVGDDLKSPNGPSMGVRGHVAFWDSEYSVTGIMETQFWRPSLSAGKAPVLSMIASDWQTTPFNGRTGEQQPDAQAMAAAVWAQMAAAVDSPTWLQKPMMDVCSEIHVDDAIIWKQPNPPGGVKEEQQPLFVNKVDTNLLRPPCDAPIGAGPAPSTPSKVYLGGDWTDTYFDVTTMESACESGRRAAGESRGDESRFLSRMNEQIH